MFSALLGYIITAPHGVNNRLNRWHCFESARFVNRSNSNGYNYLSVEGQLSYLAYELSTSYSSIYNYLKNVPDTQQGAYLAAYHWCYYFEIPTDKASKSVSRGNSAMYNYWPVYGGQDVSSPTLELSEVFDVGEKSVFTFSPFVKLCFV